MAKKTLVLGIGNCLLSDEGIGIHVIEYLRQKYSSVLPGLTYLDGGTLSFTLAGSIEEADFLIVIDAARLDAAPGTISIFLDLEMDRFLGSGRCSVHEVGLIDLLDIARLTGTMPEKRALVGIQPGELDWGDSPSAQVAETIPQVAEQVIQLARSWRRNG